MWHRFLPVFLFVAAPSLAFAQFGGPVAVRTEPVENRDARVGQALVATIEPVTQTTLAAEQAGLVTERTFDDGSTLAEGQVLVRMDTALTKIERDAAQAAADALGAQVEQAKIKSENSQRESNRMKGLFEGKIIPEKEFLDALTLARTDAAEVLVRSAEHAQKKAQVALLDLMIKKSEVRTPLGKGIVAKRYVEVGQWVKQGDPVADVVWMDPVFVRTSVPEAFIGQVKQGEQVTFTLDAVPDKPFTGEINQVLPVADPVSRTFTVKVLVKNPDGLLRPGFFARATIHSRSGRQFLVPKDAVVTAPDGQHVVVAREGKAVVVPVKRGAAEGTKLVVSGELKEGDQVVTRGNETLRGGEDLQIQNPPPAATTQAATPVGG
jgi:membrane fusion protein (multidrug efflux system)